MDRSDQGKDNQKNIILIYFPVFTKHYVSANFPQYLLLCTMSFITLQH